MSAEMVDVEKLYAFLDTNVFLEYQEYTQLDWPKLLGARRVVLVVAPMVRREIERHRTDPRSPRRQKRARDVSGKLRELVLSVDDGVEAVIPERPSTTYLELSRSPQMAKHPDLSPDVQDDHIIASMREFVEEHPDRTTLLVAGDTGLVLTARRSGLNYRYLDDAYRLPDEATAEQREIRDLKSRLSKLEKSSPELVVTIEGSNDGELVLPPTGTDDDIISPYRRWVLSFLDDLAAYRFRSEQEAVPVPNPALVDPLWYRVRMPADVIERIGEAMRTLKIGAEHFHERDLHPVRVSSRMTLSTFGDSKVEGEDLDWYKAVFSFDRRLQKVEREVHNARRFQQFRTLTLCVENTGAVTAEGLDIEIRTPNGGGYLFSQLDVWARPEDVLPFLPPPLERERPEWELRSRVHENPLTESWDSLKPGERYCSEVGFLRVPNEGERVTLTIRILGRNLNSPLQVDFSVSSQ
jgi:hypothetical protein